MHLTGLHLLLTYRCTYECDHCFVYSSPQAEATMPLSMAVDALLQARDLGTVTEIWIEGGEPFLYYPILAAVVERACDLDMACGIVTNGYFAGTVEDALIWLRPLKHAGLTMLSISDDSFHHPDTDCDSSVRHLIQAATQLGLLTDIICIHRPAEEQPHDHTKGEPILGGPVRFRGRAADTLASADLPAQPWDAFTECPDEDFYEVGRLHLDPYGNLFACQGVCIGNLKTARLSETVAFYRPDAHPIIGPLIRGGPAELVRRYHLPLNERYHDACHLCYLARRQLRDRFPAELAPPLVYGIV